jgi:hypothetical protein
MKFTFTSEFQGFGSPKNTMEFEVDQLDDVLAYFEQFLKGSGYHFDGNVIIDQETWPAIQNINFDLAEEHFNNLNQVDLTDAN